MHPVTFPGAQTIGKPGQMAESECNSIPAMPLVDPNGYQCWLTAWMPDAEDLALLNAGQPVYVKTVTNHHVATNVGPGGRMVNVVGLPPMALFTIAPKIEEEGAGA